MNPVLHWLVLHCYARPTMFKLAKKTKKKKKKNPHILCSDQYCIISLQWFHKKTLSFAFTMKRTNSKMKNLAFLLTLHRESLLPMKGIWFLNPGIAKEEQGFVLWYWKKCLRCLEAFIMLGSGKVKYRKRVLAIYGKPPPHGLLGIGIFMKIRRLKEENHLRAESLVGVFYGALGGQRNWNS